MIGVSPVSSFSQDKTKLEKQRLAAIEEINLSNKILKEKQKERQVNINQLRIVKNQIEVRYRLINNYNTEVKIISEEIIQKKSDISKLETEIKEIKEEYANMVVSAYNNKHQYDKWMFILSSNDFNQAYRRLKYLQQFTEYRKKQIQLIEQMQIRVITEIDELTQKRAKKQELVDLVEQESRLLSGEKNEISRIISKLKDNERKLKAEIRAKEKEAKRIKRVIDKILAAEKRKREEALKSKGSKQFALTPEDALISENFDKNKGKFPWPTERGIVTSSFGEHSHPVLKGIKTFNNGIDISTVNGAEVRSIFDGEVRDVWAIQGKNMAVIIKHGDYFSVYQNLKDVKVRAGDKVKSKQIIGTVFTDNSDGTKTVLHVEIWKGSKSQDPQKWLARKS